MEKIGNLLHKFIHDGGWVTLLIFAVIGILAAIVLHYSLIGFNWKWFVFFETLYGFCGWAFYNVFKTIKKYQNNEQD